MGQAAAATIRSIRSGGGLVVSSDQSVGLVLLSTHRPHALRPPQNDWLLPYLALAAGACLVAYAVRLRRAAPEQRTTMLLSGAAVVVALLCLGAIIAGQGGATPGSRGDLGVDSHDLLPLPASLQSTRIDLDCQTGTGVCTDVLEVWSAAGEPPTAVAEQLAQNLRATGWPMMLGGGAGRFRGCLPIRGVFRWAAQVCASAIPAQELTWPDGVEHRNDSIVLTIAAPNATA
jgi:hypothetical protein